MWYSGVDRIPCLVRSATCRSPPRHPQDPTPPCRRLLPLTTFTLPHSQRHSHVGLELPDGPLQVPALRITVRIPIFLPVRSIAFISNPLAVGAHDALPPRAWSRRGRVRLLLAVVLEAESHEVLHAVAVGREGVRPWRFRPALALAVLPGPAGLAAVLLEPGAVLGGEDAGVHASRSSIGNGRRDAGR